MCKMFTNLQTQTLIHNRSKGQSFAETRRVAWKLSTKAYGKGMRRRIWAKINHEDNGLKSAMCGDLVYKKSNGSNQTQKTLVVPLTKIVGTEGRCEDFDKEFHPLTKHNQQRWISVASARLAGVTLPAVELVQVGDEYYVRDGHHRVSVAKSLGQAVIDANVVSH